MAGTVMQAFLSVENLATFLISQYRAEQSNIIYTHLTFQFDGNVNLALQTMPESALTCRCHFQLDPNCLVFARI